MICGIHYFITKLKTKIDVIPREFFNISEVPGTHLQLSQVKHVRVRPQTSKQCPNVEKGETCITFL